MKEEFPPTQNKEGSIEGKVIEDIGHSLEQTGQELKVIDPETVSPEQLRRLDGKVQLLYGILGLYLGYKIFGGFLPKNFGQSVVHDTDGFKLLGDTFLRLGQAFIGVALSGSFIIAGYGKVLEGLEKMVTKDK